MRLLLFDVDLTLINTGGAGLRALDRACRKLLQLENAMDGVNPQGKTDPAIVREIIRVKRNSKARSDDIEIVLEAYLFFLKEEIATSTTYRVMPGIFSLLTELAGRSDVILGLATGNLETGARIKLERGGLNSFFQFGGFGSDSEDRTELVRKAVEKAAALKKVDGLIPRSNIFVIGDTPLDIDAGHRAGFKTVGVATGSYSVEQLQAAGASTTVSDLEQGRDYFLRSVFIE